MSDKSIVSETEVPEIDQSKPEKLTLQVRRVRVRTDVKGGIGYRNCTNTSLSGNTVEGYHW